MIYQSLWKSIWPASAAVFTKFSSRHPALVYALASLLGFYAACSPTPWLSIPLLPFLILGRQRIVLTALLFTTLFLHAKINFPDPQIPHSGQHRQVLFSPSSISSTRSAFGSQWVYRGTASFENFTLPCQIRITSRSALRPPADRSYLIEGTLKRGQGYSYTLVVDKKMPWLAVEKSWNAAEWRYTSKQWVKKYVSKHYSSFSSAQFLTAILTGDLEDLAIKKAFGKAGLQHILAISGFHFTILTTVFLFLLRFILPPKWALNALIFLLCTYFVFLGSGASILRAWLMSLVAIIGLLYRQTPAALNSLGFAILIVLAIDPQLTLSIGFIFSFAVTASILIFFPISLWCLETLFPPRDISLLKQMGLADQHSYLIVCTAKNILALTLAVNVTAIPLTLFFFGTFPLISLLCNLVVPLMVSLSMLLFVLGVFVPWLHPVNQTIVGMLLDFVQHLPAPLHIHWRLSLGKPALCCWLTAALLLGIWGRQRLDRPALEIIC